jgi:hypothetical protein
MYSKLGCKDRTIFLDYKEMIVILLKLFRLSDKYLAYCGRMAVNRGKARSVSLLYSASKAVSQKR